MVETTPQNQIAELENKVNELTRKLEELTNPATMPDQFIQTLVKKGFVKHEFDIVTFENVSGLQQIDFMANFKENRGLINYRPASQLILYTASTSDTLTATNHGLSDTQQVYTVTTGQYPAPLNNQAIFYVRDATRNTFKLAETSGGPAIDITTEGSGNNYILVTL